MDQETQTGMDRCGESTIDLLCSERRPKAEAAKPKNYGENNQVNTFHQGNPERL